MIEGTSQSVRDEQCSNFCFRNTKELATLASVALLVLVELKGRWGGSAGQFLLPRILGCLLRSVVFRAQ
jgi:hypothetical protein